MSYYDLLGIDKTASTEEVKKAYRQKALQLHPDKNPGNAADAEEQFRAITEAYEVLGNTRKRSAYDLLHTASGSPADVPFSKQWSSGDEDHFDRWLRRWMKDNGFGPEGQAEMKRRDQWARRSAAWAAQKAAWEDELHEAKRQKERDYRMRQRMAEARAAKQAAALRQFWQTHHGPTWQDGMFLLVMSFFSVAGVWLLWPPRAPKAKSAGLDRETDD